MREREFLTPVTENFLHAIGVGKVAYELAQKFNVDPEAAFIAGSLHDLGGAIPDFERVRVAELFQIPLFKEEIDIPMLVHAKQGEFFARTLFGIHDSDILDAILFHTTCIDNATDLVKIIFIADKIHWDRNGEPPYLEGLLEALDESLTTGCNYFLEWLWNSELYVVHPFLRRSYGYYIKDEKFPKWKKSDITNINDLKISSKIREKYFLNEIKSEFEKIFRLSKSAYKLAQKELLNPDEAFIGAALTTASDSIFGDQKYVVAKALGLNLESENLISEINYYFAKSEFGVENPNILDAILNYQDKNNGDNQKLSIVIREAYQLLLN
ncbi:putative HD superfamily hydrolase of NAD metabolism [Enterococcus malodoratus]|uniref:bis(5'-nucleosyl)-tetraphosphatase (symmetrical) YqeK n=1 Tax=Enterococcus malodoratus TaxID=71451 RepID=UPI0008CB62B0|nr:bis(5'-nucleosyl)-tetraphosphatase (symmetrical) YqeK [Enterococcus malodoratus]SET34249.1 putative HD superfamily hydrolase of NAD metabolism [Enterococcus malodoratus]